MGCGASKSAAGATPVVDPEQTAGAPDPPMPAPQVSTSTPQVTPQPKPQPAASSEKEFAIELQTENIPDMITAMISDDTAKILVGTRALRKLLSRVDPPPPLDEVLNEPRGGAARLMELMKDPFTEAIRFEAAWAVTNLASGKSHHTQQVINLGALPIFVAMCSEKSVKMRDQAVWALGNISGDSPELRDLVIAAGAVAPVLEHMQPLVSSRADIVYLRNVAWALSNFCRGKPFVDHTKMGDLMPQLVALLEYNDSAVQSDAAWGLSNLTMVDAAAAAVANLPRTGSILAGLLSTDHVVSYPVIRIIGNIVSGSEASTQKVVEGNVLPKLVHVLDEAQKKNIRKDSFWALSNIMAGTVTQIQAAIDANMIPQIKAAMAPGTDLEVTREALYCFANAVDNGNHEQREYMIDQGLVACVVDTLSRNNTAVTTCALQGLADLCAEETGSARLAELLRSEEAKLRALRESGQNLSKLGQILEFVDASRGGTAKEEKSEAATAAAALPAVATAAPAEKSAEEEKVRTVTPHAWGEKWEEVFVEGNAEEEAAALKIQAMQRGQAARKEVEEMKAAAATAAPTPGTGEGEEVFFEGTAEEEAAALKIQAMQRGKAARKEVDEMKAAAGTTASETEASAPAAQAEEEVFFEGTAEEEAAALKIQAMQRGKAARKEVDEMKAATGTTVPDAEATPEAEASAPAAQAEEEVFFEGTAEEEAAALKIQAMQRGKAARKEVEEMKATAGTTEAGTEGPTASEEQPATAPAEA